MTSDGDRARLLAAVADAPLDEHARLVAQLLGADAALITVVDDEEQRFLGIHGLDGAAMRRGTPLDRSLCRTVASTHAPLRLDDLGASDEWRDHPARTDLGVEAYLGVPLASPDGEVVGAVCALQHEPRTWTPDDADVVVAMRDLVEVELRALLRARAEADRAREIALLLSTLRHELGGELQIVLGGIETATLPDLDADLRDQVLHNARRDCRRAIDTLDALLRMDSRAPARQEEVELPTLLVDVVRTTPLRGDAERIHLDVPTLRLVTEPVLLRHVVGNLLDNASKYSDGVIRLTAARRERVVAVTVADDGPGIPDDVVGQLFQPFSRARDDGGASGFGLGLYIIRTLCEQLGAELEVATGPHGTAITVLLPGDQSPKPSNAASSSDAE